MSFEGQKLTREIARGTTVSPSATADPALGGKLKVLA